MRVKPHILPLPCSPPPRAQDLGLSPPSPSQAEHLRQLLLLSARWIRNTCAESLGNGTGRKCVTRTHTSPPPQRLYSPSPLSSLSFPPNISHGLLRPTSRNVPGFRSYISPLWDMLFSGETGVGEQEGAMESFHLRTCSIPCDSFLFCFHLMIAHLCCWAARGFLQRCHFLRSWWLLSNHIAFGLIFFPNHFLFHLTSHHWQWGFLGLCPVPGFCKAGVRCLPEH